MPRALPSVSHDQVALEACTLLETLEVLWGRANEMPGGAPVSPPQLRALTVIESWEGINLRDLGEALGSTPPSVSRLCDRLEAAGLLQRSRGTLNRREVELRLSRRGQEVLAQMRAWRAREIKTVLSRLPATQLDALSQSLQAFSAAAALEACVEEPEHSENRVADTA